MAFRGTTTLQLSDINKTPPLNESFLADDWEGTVKSGQ